MFSLLFHLASKSSNIQWFSHNVISKGWQMSPEVSNIPSYRLHIFCIPAEGKRVGSYKAYYGWYPASLACSWYPISRDILISKSHSIVFFKFQYLLYDISHFLVFPSYHQIFLILDISGLDVFQCSRLHNGLFIASTKNTEIQLDISHTCTLSSLRAGRTWFLYIFVIFAA